MVNNATLEKALRGGCPAPFYEQAQFGFDGCRYLHIIHLQLLTSTVVGGRFCAPVDPSKGLFCCLPCPLTDFLYPDSFNSTYRVAEALNVAGLICLVFLLITFMVLPAEKTRRHYLSYCLIVAAMFMAVSVIFPRPIFIL
jgi:hypothetical protein